MKTLRMITALALFLVMAAAAHAQQIPIVLEEVEVDGTTVYQNSVNLLSLERGEDYEVRVRFTPYLDVDNAIVRVSIDGYEFSDSQDIEDETQVFDANTNVTYVKKLSVRIPDDVDSDSYKLHVEISDRFSQKLIADYNLQIDVPRNAVSVDDVVFNPSDAVRAGSSLLTTVRVENKGEKDQQDVKVTVSIPGLGVSGTQYIEEIESDDEEEETEEIFLRIPKCAKAGTYDVNVEVEFMKRHRKVNEKRTITVLEDDTCDENVPKTTITLGSQAQNVVPGQSAVFPVTVTNAARTSKTFTVTVPSSEWASTVITPTSTLVIPAGQTQTVFVNVNVGEDTPQGAHSLAATITSGKDQHQLTLTANVLEQPFSAKGVFEVVLIVLVVLLVILALVIGIVHLHNRDQTEPYY